MSLNNAYGNDNAYGKELRESLLNEILDLSPKDTPLYTRLKKSKATQSIHSFLDDRVSRSSSSGAVAEGATTTYSDQVSPRRNVNYVQEIEKSVSVTQKQSDSESAGYKDPYEYFKSKQMAAWKMSAEWSIIHGTGISGGSGSAWEMNGLRKVITTNFVSYASGTSLTEARFNDILELMYDDVTDDTVDVFVNIKLKRQISSFTASNTKNIEAGNNKIINRIDVYESDVASTVRLNSHRDLASTNMTLIAMQMKAFAVAHMREPEHQERAKVGAFDQGAIYGSLTLEYRNERAAVLATGLIA